MVFEGWDGQTGVKNGDMSRSVLILSTPFAETAIPSIQLALLESYLKERGVYVKTRHLYLKAADFYGLKNYNFLISYPNSPYVAQMVFSKYVFPTHWKNTIDRFKEYFNKRILPQMEEKKRENNDNVSSDGSVFDFDCYVQRTDMFYEWVVNNVDWRSHDIVGFTLNYGQFLPSLAFAKRIKELCPDKMIVFGGSRTVDMLGIRVLEAFDYVDFVVSGDGEKPLYMLSTVDDPSSVPGLMYRRGEKIFWNKNNDSSVVDLNTLPIPLYDQFYKDMSMVCDEIKQYFQVHGRLPVEISRGCWWKKCSFCNLNIQYNKYREKNVDKIVEEIKFLSNKHKILSFQIIGNTLPKKNYRVLFKKIMETNIDLNFFVEARAGDLKSNDYTLMKKAGFSAIQTGIEAFSQSYLKKMNKGVRVIDNIASLKFCMENNIENRYNIIIGYPNEEEIDFEETKRNIQFIRQYIDPPRISPLIVGYGSPIHKNPEKFNIKKLEYMEIDKIMFPRDVLKKNISFFYSFKKKKKIHSNSSKWKKLVSSWKNECEQQTKHSGVFINKPVFFYMDGGGFLKIYDRRHAGAMHIYVLDELERKIFLLCKDIVSLQDLKKNLPDIPESKILSILQMFERQGIVFQENNFYLALPLQYSKVI